jgi:uncharacterized protein YkwD
MGSALTGRVPLCRMTSGILRIPWLVGAALLWSTGTAAAAGPEPCRGAYVVPTPQTVKLARAATLCLINQVRRSSGVPAVRVNPRLRRAAQRHSEDMLGRMYFSHATPEGVDMTARVALTGYIPKKARWRLGENLAAGFETGATPVWTVLSWIHSPKHAGVLVDPIYREIGLGLTTAVKPAGGRGAVYTADFGRRGS